MARLFLLLFFVIANPALADLQVALGDLEPGESVTFRYIVKVKPSNSLPAGTTSISTQGIATADNASTVQTDDPGINGFQDATVTPLFLLDSDGDGVLDDLDGCPTDPAKLAPANCGCNVQDLDVNANGIFDCLANLDLKTLLATVQQDVKKLKPNSKLRNKKKRKAQGQRKKAIKQNLKFITEIVQNSASSLTLANDSANLESLFKAFRSKLKKALRTGSPNIGKFKKQSNKATKKLNGAIA